MMKPKFIVAIVGIATIGAIIVACILKGIDGTVVAAGCGMIGSIVGFAFGKKLKD